VTEDWSNDAENVALNHRNKFEIVIPSNFWQVLCVCVYINIYHKRCTKLQKK